MESYFDVDLALDLLEMKAIEKAHKEYQTFESAEGDEYTLKIAEFRTSQIGRNYLDARFQETGDILAE